MANRKTWPGGVIQHQTIIKKYDKPWAIVGKIYKVQNYGKTEHCQILWTGYMNSIKLNVMVSKYLTFYGFNNKLFFFNTKQLE